MASKNFGTKENPNSSKILRFPSDVGKYPMTSINVYKVSYEQNKNSDLSKTGEAITNVTNNILDKTSEGIERFSNLLSNFGIKSGGGEGFLTNTIKPSVERGTNSLVKDLTGAVGMKRTVEQRITIALPLPIDLNVNYSHEWSGNSLTSLQYTIRELAKNGYSSQGIGEAIERGSKFLGTEIIKNFVGRSSIEGIAGAGNISFNPYRELLFESSSFRSFTLEWVLSPKNSKESDTLSEIIYSLKKYSHAQTLNNTNLEDSIILEFPYFADVELWSNEESGINPYFFKFLSCAITNISIRYDTKLHRDTKAPVATSLSIGFLETKILTQKDFGDSFDKSKQYY